MLSNVTDSQTYYRFFLQFHWTQDLCIIIFIFLEMTLSANKKEIENANPTTFLKYHNNPGKWAQQETLGRTRHMFGACMRSWRTAACRKADGLWEGWPLTSVPHGRIWRVFHVVRKAEKLLGTASDEAVQRFLHQLQLLNLSMELLLVPPQEAGDGAPTSAHREGSC